METFKNKDAAAVNLHTAAQFLKHMLTCATSPLTPTCPSVPPHPPQGSQPSYHHHLQGRRQVTVALPSPRLLPDPFPSLSVSVRKGATEETLVFL